MISIYRRHNPKRCNLTLRTQIKCKCPIWAAGMDADGHKVREALKTRDWFRAQNIAREWDAVGRKPKPSTRVTLTELDAAFMADADARSLAFETKRKYRGLFKQLNAFAAIKGIQFVNEIDIPFLSDFRASWKDKALSATKKLEQLRGICKFALARKWIPDNPALALQMPQVKPSPTLPFSDAEMKKIIRATANPRERAFVLTMRFSGLRISDTAILERSSLNGNELSLYTHKTGSSVRVPIPKIVAAALRKVPNGNQKHFFWTGGSKITTVCGFWRKRLDKIFTKAKVENGHSHRFRDTFAVGLLLAGVSLEDVSTLLGHESIKVTEKHYSPWIQTRQNRLTSEVARANRGYKLGTILQNA
jgi:integrase